MSLFSTWEERANQSTSQQEQEAFWRDYLVKEQTNYEMIIESKEPSLKGKISDLAAKYSMDEVTFVGFLDGINTSLEAEINLEELDADSEIDSTIVWSELFKNMLNAKADWLFNIEAWDGIFTADERKTLRKEYNKTRTVVKEVKIGRNDPCPCGSGKKYKKCCLNK